MPIDERAECQALLDQLAIELTTIQALLENREDQAEYYQTRKEINQMKAAAIQDYLDSLP
jgi:hypothetical protein